MQRKTEGGQAGSVGKLIKYPAYINASPGLAWHGLAWLDSLGRVSIMQMLVGKCNLNSKTNSRQAAGRQDVEQVAAAAVAGAKQ